MSITAVIPAYNEQNYIAEVITKAQKYVDRVIVIDNMSTDNTAQVVSSIIPQVDYYMCANKGAGASTRLGIAYALNPIYKYADIIVTLDADGQHDADEIPLLIEPIKSNEAQLVIGSRFMRDYTIEKYRKFGIDVITWLYNVKNKNKIIDGQSCFRAFTREVASTIRITEDGFGFSTEFLVKARASNYKITEVPISCIYHKEFSENSTSNPVTHGLNVAWNTVKWRIREEL